MDKEVRPQELRILSVREAMESVGFSDFKLPGYRMTLGVIKWMMEKLLCSQITIIGTKIESGGTTNCIFSTLDDCGGANLVPQVLIDSAMLRGMTKEEFENRFQRWSEMEKDNG
jgi:hypothetical protein